MTFVIITHVPHIFEQQKYYAYAPYVREMNIWLKYVNQVTIVAPIEKTKLDNIHLAYQHKNLIFKEVPNFNLTNFSAMLPPLNAFAAALVYTPADIIAAVFANPAAITPVLYGDLDK